MTIRCPAHVEFLMHCHVSPEPFERWDVPMYLDLAAQFLHAGIIEKTSDMGIIPPTYGTTPLGRAWVNAICNTPLPKSVYVDEQGRVL